jgi:hypothetical protein
MAEEFSLKISGDFSLWASHQEEREVYELGSSLELWSGGCHLVDADNTKTKCHQQIWDVLRWEGGFPWEGDG